MGSYKIEKITSNTTPHGEGIGTEPEIITNYGKGLEPKIDQITDFGKGIIRYKSEDGREWATMEQVDQANKEYWDSMIKPKGRGR